MGGAFLTQGRLWPDIRPVEKGNAMVAEACCEDGTWEAFTSDRLP